MHVLRIFPPLYRCVSGQTGRFVYREQADLKRFFPSLKRTVRVDAFVVLVDTGSEATVASTGDLAPVPYLNQVCILGGCVLICFRRRRSFYKMNTFLYFKHE
jgi:hypothetical protein